MNMPVYLFTGFLDTVVKEGFGKEFSRLAAHYRDSAKRSRKWSVMFRSYAALAEVMSVKYELGVKTRAAYQKGDKEELYRLANEDYTLLLKKLRNFQLSFEKQWYSENKPYGFDVQELRIGGVATRAESCKRRLLDYAKGKISEIPELAEKLIERMADEDSEFITVYSGKSAKKQAAEEMLERLEDAYDDFEVSLKKCGQPLYYYIISVE